MKKKPLHKKWWVWLLGLMLIGAIGSIGDDEEPEAEPKTEEVAEAEEPEEVESVDPNAAAIEWVEDHEKENIDTAIADYQAITDETLKAKIEEQVAGSDTTLYDKRVEVTGTAVEWVEGSDGMDKGSFVVYTDAGYSVRVSAKTPNDALDLGEKVEVTGKLTSPIGAEQLYVREASVYIQ